MQLIFSISYVGTIGWNSLNLGIEISSLPIVPGKTLPPGSMSLSFRGLYLARASMSFRNVEVPTTGGSSSFHFCPVHMCLFVCLCVFKFIVEVCVARSVWGTWPSLAGKRMMAFSILCEIENTSHSFCVVSKAIPESLS